MSGELFRRTAAGFEPFSPATTADRVTYGEGTVADALRNAIAYAHPAHTAHSGGFYRVTVDGLGHVVGAAAVTKEDITALGIPGTSLAALTNEELEELLQ